MSRPVILSAVRTPVGRYGGALAEVRPDDLAAAAIGAAVERAGVEPGEIEDVYFGAANQAGEDNRNVARMAALLAGLPESVAGVTLNRLCASGLSAVVSACHAVAAGDGELFVAGGVESMTRAPLVMAKPEHGFPRGNQTVWDTTLGWRFPNPRMEEMFPLESMGETGENVAERWDVSREDQDEFALRSQQRWAAADFSDELVAVNGVERDEHPRPDTTREKLGSLRPVFREGGTVTAGNSSGINDGAAALVIASEEKARELGAQPLGAFVGSAVAGVDPRVMGIGPIPAVRKLLDRAGVAVDDLDLVELNEAFASQSLVVIRELGLDPREGQCQRRRDRDRTPARDERRAPGGHPPARTAAARRPLRPGDALRRRRPGPGRALRAVSVAERYVELCLRLGRHVDGLVDAYYGDPAVQERIDAEALSEPASLAEDAARLRAELDGLEAQRRRWLHAQLVGIETVARKLAGEEFAFADEVERCYGVRPRRIDESNLEAAHAALDEVLPGTESLADRYQQWRESQVVPAEKLGAVLGDIVEELRRRTADLVGLPGGESYELELVSDEPWAAYNYYEGHLRSRIAVNTDVPMATNFVSELMAHELYPGHQTEHSWKEQLLYRDAGWPEASILMIGTPESTIAEGIAGLAVEIVVEDEDAFAAEILSRYGISYDAELGRAVKGVRKPLARASGNAAFMLYEDGATEEETTAYLKHWALMSDRRGNQAMKFVLDPMWRSYVTTYEDGYEVCKIVGRRRPGTVQAAAHGAADACGPAQLAGGLITIRPSTSSATNGRPFSASQASISTISSWRSRSSPSPRGTSTRT